MNENDWVDVPEGDNNWVDVPKDNSNWNDPTGDISYTDALMRTLNYIPTSAARAASMGARKGAGGGG